VKQQLEILKKKLQPQLLLWLLLCVENVSIFKSILDFFFFLTSSDQQLGHKKKLLPVIRGGGN
jgi:hypothetical protein